MQRIADSTLQLQRHVSELKSWKISKEEPDVSEGRMTTSEELSKETEDIPGVANTITEQDEEMSTDVRRSERVRRKPVRLQDYIISDEIE